MAFPATPLFEAFLSKTRLVREKPHGLAVEFTAKSPAVVSQAPVLYLAYPDMEIGIEAVVRRIETELRDRGCTTSERIAIATLGLVVESRPVGASCVEHVNC